MISISGCFKVIQCGYVCSVLVKFWCGFGISVSLLMFGCDQYETFCYQVFKKDQKNERKKGRISNKKPLKADIKVENFPLQLFESV